MLYASPEHNLVDLIYRCGTLKFEQLAEFFDPVIKPEQLQRLLIKYKFMHKIDVDEKGVATWIGGGKFSKHVQEAIQYAFWIVANFGYSLIEEIWIGGYPTVICFTTTDGEAYDISVCMTDAYAERARAKIQKDRELRHQVSLDDKDPFYHICLVPFKENGPRYKGFGFDSYCVIEKYTNQPKYFKFE